MENGRYGTEEDSGSSINGRESGENMCITKRCSKKNVREPHERQDEKEEYGSGADVQGDRKWDRMDLTEPYPGKGSNKKRGGPRYEIIKTKY